MAYDLSNDKVLKAVDCLIRDNDRKYDECLVDRFMNYIETQVSPIASTVSGYIWTVNVQRIMDKLKSYTDHKAFVMLNQARALKVFRSILMDKRLSSDDIEFYSSHLDSLWNTIDMLVVNENTAGLAIMMSVLTTISSSGAGLLWLLNKKIEPPIKLHPIFGRWAEVRDIVGLVRFYLQVNNNYHLATRAEILFCHLIEQTIVRDLPASHPQMNNIKEAMQDLMDKGSSSMIRITMNLFENITDTIVEHRLDDQYGLKSMILRCFSYHINKPSILNMICKSLAIVNRRRRIGDSRDNITKGIVEELMRENKLEAIIIYLANSCDTDSSTHQAFLRYTLYPILISCDGDKDDDVGVCAQRLLATREEMDFIERNMNQRLVTTCLVQLDHIFSRNYSTFSKIFSGLSLPGDFKSKSVHMIVTTLLCYIRKHYNSQTCHKNVVECCAILKTLDYLTRDRDATLLWKILNTLRDILSNIYPTDQPTGQAKVITIKLLSLYRVFYRQYTAFRNIPAFRNDVKKRANDIVNMGFKYEDPDILNEIVLLFVQNRFDLKNSDRESTSTYIKLIWSYMYHKRFSDHLELRGNLAYLLIDLDLAVDLGTIECEDIVPNSTIPSALGELLQQKSAVVSTVEAVIDAIHEKSCRGEAYKFEPSKPLTYGYVCLLDRPKIAHSAREALKTLTIGICCAIKSEASEVARVKAMNVINDLIWEFVVNTDDPRAILRRLLESRILETIHDICTDDTQPPELQKECVRKVSYIKTNVIQKVPKSYEKILDFVGNAKVARYFTRAGPGECGSKLVTSPRCHALISNSVVDDILNSEFSERQMECY